MGENIFEKQAKNENRIVELMSDGVDVKVQFANIHLIFGAMLWPDERPAFESMVLGCLSGIEDRAENYHPNASEDFLNIPSFMEETFRQELSNNQWHGYCAGEAFLMYLQCKEAGLDISIRKAHYLTIEDVRGGIETRNGDIRTISDKTMRVAWRKFYNSLHIWAAFVILNIVEGGKSINQNHLIDKDGDSKQLFKMAEIANQLRQIALENDYMKRSGQRLWEPISFTCKSISNEKKYFLGLPTPEMISALESYELRDAKQRNKYKKIPFSGGS